MYSFIRKFVPFRKESIPIQNKKLTPENNTDRTVTASDETDILDSDSHGEVNISEQNEDEDCKATDEKDAKHVESIRRGINNLLREFKKENINVATLMDQDGRIFFSIDMTVIISQDEKLNSIVKAVQKSMEESSNRILVDQNVDEVAQKLRRHFLFESNREVNVEEIPKLESVDIETQEVHAENKISHSIERQNSSEETLVNNSQDSGEILMSVSADETELTSLFYSYVKKFDKKRKSISKLPIVIKRDKSEKSTKSHTEKKQKKTRNRTREPDLKLDHKSEKNVRLNSKEKRYYKRKHFKTECTSKEGNRQQETKRNRYKRESIQYIKRKIRKQIRKRSKKPESKNRKKSGKRKESEERKESEKRKESEERKEMGKRKESENKSRRRRRSKRQDSSHRNPSIENAEAHKKRNRTPYKERREKQEKTKVVESVGENEITTVVVEKQSSKYIKDVSVAKDSQSNFQDNVIEQNEGKNELRENTDLKHERGDFDEPLEQTTEPRRKTKSNEIRILLQKMIEECPQLKEIDVGGSSEEVITVTSFERSS